MRAPVVYVLDANVFIEAARRYYAFDLVPRFWTAWNNLRGTDGSAAWIMSAGSWREVTTAWLNGYQAISRTPSLRQTGRRFLRSSGTSWDG